MPANEIRFKQILAADYDSSNGRAHVLYGLGEDGVVYKYQHSSGGWIAMPTAVATVTPGRPSRQRQVSPTDRRDEDIPF